jgi:hypothetical protein
MQIAISPGVRAAPLLKIAAHCDDRGTTTRRLPALGRADKMPGGLVVRDANGPKTAEDPNRDNRITPYFDRI